MPLNRYQVSHSPIVAPEKETTVFEAYFDLGIDGIGHADRVLKRVSACDSILPDSRFDFGMAVGVGGEILPETLEKMVEEGMLCWINLEAPRL
uniref:Uncharacterized protein n=1 Tax=Noccaea caerulescens TaxID=107243 RepID=A0A1J3DZ40_NOCCA